MSRIAKPGPAFLVGMSVGLLACGGGSKKAAEPEPVNAIEAPATIAGRIKKVLAAVPADRVVLSTDCGMKPLARMVAKMKLHSLAEGASMVRKEVAGV